MAFNSFEFFAFLCGVFLLYWHVLQRHLRLQNLFILLASYVFYGRWDYRFLALIVLSTLVDYWVGLQLGKTEDKRKRIRLLAISLIVNLGALGFFKYYNFFAENFVDLFAQFGIQLSPVTLKIILPAGISFYTFQTLSYSIDVYRKKIEPCRDLILFGAYVSFFPQLVAGPIERAANLIPQFARPRTFDYALAKDGTKQILWGLFKKVVIADTCGSYANLIFETYDTQNSLTLIAGSIFFAFQIYGDFSGYSDIAIGTAKLFGFRLMTNFRYPYFSRDIAEFWRRWHISLSTWFRDYLYIPLGGSRVSTPKQIRNTFIIFLVSGFWHGANWTFIVWGFLNALYFLPLQLFKRNRRHLDIADKGQTFPKFGSIWRILLTFTLTCFAWIFFRADNLSHAFAYIQGIFSNGFNGNHFQVGFDIIFMIAVLLIIEWKYRDQDHPVAFPKMNAYVKMALYFFLFYSIIAYYDLNNQDFIYFQF